MSRKTLKNGEFINDPYGYEDEELSESESENETHYRHWGEENNSRKENGYKPNPYKPLDDE
jgi:hypothetical protein